MTDDYKPPADENPAPTDQTEPPDAAEPQQPAESQEPSETGPATPKAHSKKTWITLGVVLALVIGSVCLWRFLPPVLPGTIVGHVYGMSKTGMTNLSVTACQVVDGSRLGQCTTIHDDDGTIARYGDFKIGGLKRGVPYAVYATADGAWPTWMAKTGSRDFRQALPTMDDVSKYPIRLITIPVRSTQIYGGDIDLEEKRGITGTIAPLEALSKNLDVEICKVWTKSITDCSSDGITIDLSTGQYAAINIESEYDYTVFASADGYLRTWLGGTTSMNPGYLAYSDDLPSSAIISHPASTVRTNQNISLVQGATITGTVSPEIAGNRKVFACPVTLKNPTDLPNTNCGIAATDSYGHYSITVPAGATVDLVAQADGFDTTWMGGCVGGWWDCHHNPDPEYDYDADWIFLVTPVTAPDAGQTLADQNWKLAKHSTISGTFIGDPGEYTMAFACQFVVNSNSSGDKTLTTTNCTHSNTTQDEPGTWSFATPVDLLFGPSYLDVLQPDTDYVVYTTTYKADGTAVTVFVGGCRSHWREDVSYQCLVDSGGIIHTPAGGGDIKGLTLDVS